METKNFIFDGDGTEYEFESQVSTSREAAESGEEQSNTKAGSTQSSKVTSKSGSQHNDLEAAIEAMISDDGKFSISKVQGIVTVTDTPEVLRKVEDYITQINSIVNKRIAVKTEVYEIRIEDTANLGMDINALYDSAIDVAGAAAPNFKGGFNSGGLNFSITDGTSKFNGSNAVIDALARVSNVSLVTSSMNYTTNGKLVPLQIASEKGIVSSMSPVLDDEGNVVGFDAKTGSVLSGLTMNLTPRVNSTGDVDLNFAADLSSLDQIKTVELGEQGGKIDVVDRSFKNFMQRASVDSGDTLMIAGFDRIENKSDVESVGGESVWALGGSKKGGKVRIMTMIMVTPYIMAR
jgi:type IVB pilus formation R64 PilN family outer membrane protein